MYQGMLCLSLQYLHNEKKLLHGDMKSCNVVIKGDFETVKICDVGVSLQLDENMKGNDCVEAKVIQIALISQSANCSEIIQTSVFARSM